MVFAPFFKIAAKNIAQIRSYAIVLIQFAVSTDIDGMRFEDSSGIGRKIMVGDQPVENHIAPVCCGLGIGARVEKTGVIHHSHEYGGFVDAEAVRFFMEKSTGCSANA